MSKNFLQAFKISFFLMFLGVGTVISDPCNATGEKERRELISLQLKISPCKKHPTPSETTGTPSSCNRCASNAKLLSRIQELESELGIDERRARRLHREFLNEQKATTTTNDSELPNVVG